MKNFIFNSNAKNKISITSALFSLLILFFALNCGFCANFCSASNSDDETPELSIYEAEYNSKHSEDGWYSEEDKKDNRKTNICSSEEEEDKKDSRETNETDNQDKTPKNNEEEDKSDDSQAKKDKQSSEEQESNSKDLCPFSCLLV